MGSWCALILLLQQVDSPPEPPDHSEILVVTAQAKPESQQDSLYRVQVIPRETILRRAAPQLAELLRLEAAAQVSEHSVFGSGLSLNGLGGEHVKILVDGLPVLGRLNGIIDLNQLPLDQVEQVELIEGPVSTYYGTDAMGGVVNLITLVPGDGFQAQVSSLLELNESGDQRGLSPSASASYGWSGHALRAWLQQRQTKAFDLDPATRNRDGNPRQMEQGGLQYHGILGSLKMRLGSDQLVEEMEEWGALSRGRAQDNLYHTERTNHHALLRGFLRPGLYLDGHIAHLDYLRYRDTTSYVLQGEDLVPVARLQGDDPSAQQVWQGKAQVTLLNDAGNWQLQLGLESTSERAEGQRILGGRKTLRDEALFTSLRWNGSKSLSFQGSLRLMDHSVFATDPTHSLQVLGKSGHGQWRASWSSGFRAPSAKELFLDFPMSAGPLRYHIHGNAGLRPERGRHFAASWQGDLAQSPLRWALEAFHNEVRNAIALSSLEADPLLPNLFHRTYLNLEKHETFGGRLHLSHQGSRLQSGLSWAPTAKRELLAQNYAELASRRWIHDGQLDLAAKLPLQLAVQLSLTHRGSREAYVQQNGAPSLSRSESYQRLDLGFVRHFRQLEWRFGCKNLLDVTQLDQVLVETGSAHASETVDWGRTYYTQLSLRSGAR